MEVPYNEFKSLVEECEFWEDQAQIYAEALVLALGIATQDDPKWTLEKRQEVAEQLKQILAE